MSGDALDGGADASSRSASSGLELLLNPGRGASPTTRIDTTPTRASSSRHARSARPSSHGPTDPQMDPSLTSPCFVHSNLDRGVHSAESSRKPRRWSSRNEQGMTGSASPMRRRRDKTRQEQDGEDGDDDETPHPLSRHVYPASYFEVEHPMRSGQAYKGTGSLGGCMKRGRLPDAVLADEREHSGSDATVGQDRYEREQHGQGSDEGSEGGSWSGVSGFSASSEEEDEDRLRSLTRQLAETAVGVREMSKQLGRARVKSTIQSVLIITKARDNHLIKLTRELAIWLMTTPRNGKDTGLIVYVDSQLRKSKRFDAEGICREYPEVTAPPARPPRRTASISSSLSSTSGQDGSGSSGSGHREEGQLRYWNSDMCSRSPHLFDFVVTLGGDGTVLFCSWLFQRVVPPVLPFALGSLGFLTNFDFARYKEVMKSALDDGIRVNLRMRFTATVYRASLPSDSHLDRDRRRAIRSGKTGEIIMRNIKKGGWDALESPCRGSPEEAPETNCRKDKEVMCFSTHPVETFEVLNDLVVDRGPSPYVSLLEVFGDEHHMTTAQADGLCISTPTGSTAYSLSAGGSLVHPEIPAILITPICPHTLSFRPMLLPDSMELRICVPYNSRSTAWASFDGRGRVELKQGDHIKVSASRYPFPTVCADKQSTDWFEAISRTLKWNERQRQKSFVVVEEGNDGPEGRSDQKEAHKDWAEKTMEDSISPADGKPKGGNASEQGSKDGGHGADDEDEEQEEFDIDDTSTTVTRANSPLSSQPASPGNLSASAYRRRSMRSEKRMSRSVGSEGSNVLPVHRGGHENNHNNNNHANNTNNSFPRLAALTPQYQHGIIRSGRSNSLLNSPDRFGLGGPPQPPRQLSERHLAQADFRLDAGPAGEGSSRENKDKKVTTTTSKVRGSTEGRPAVPATPSSALSSSAPAPASGGVSAGGGGGGGGQGRGGEAKGGGGGPSSSASSSASASSSSGKKRQTGGGTALVVYGEDESDESESNTE